MPAFLASLLAALVSVLPGSIVPEPIDDDSPV